MSVIVAEADPDLAEVFTAILNRSGYATRHAASGPDALQLVTERRPRLLILDDRMPGLDGLDVARWLRADTDTATLPLVMVTGGQPPQAHDLFDRVLTKPISSHSLQHAVQDLLAEPPPATQRTLPTVLTNKARLRAVARVLALTDCRTRTALDDLVHKVADRTGASMAAITVTLNTSVVLLASVSAYGPLAEVGGMPAEWAPCTTITATGQPLLITDVDTDPQYAATPLHAVYGARAYAGVPLSTEAGVVGSLCAMHQHGGIINDATIRQLSYYQPRLRRLLHIPRPW